MPPVSLPLSRRLLLCAAVFSLHIGVGYALARSTVSEPRPRITAAPLQVQFLAPTVKPVVPVIEKPKPIPPEPRPEPPKPKAKPKKSTLLASRTPTPSPVVVPPERKPAPKPEPQPAKLARKAEPAATSPMASEPRADLDYLNNPAPRYPAMSKRLGETGEALVRVRVQPDGSVSDIRLEKTSGFERLDQAALAAVRRWRFAPARQGENAVAAWALVPVRFELTR